MGRDGGERKMRRGLKEGLVRTCLTPCCEIRLGIDWRKGLDGGGWDVWFWGEGGKV